MKFNNDRCETWWSATPASAINSPFLKTVTLYGGTRNWKWCEEFLLEPQLNSEKRIYENMFSNMIWDYKAGASYKILSLCEIQCECVGANLPDFKAFIAKK